MFGIDDERYSIRSHVKQKKAFHFDHETELDMFAKNYTTDLLLKL